jgi:hypothetical protein
MKPAELLRLRLENQRIARAGFRQPEDAVAWFGAVQAQDYLGSLWAIGLRMRAATEAMVEAAETRRAIIRTWPLRGTLHFVAADDARWMTATLAPRVIARNSARWQRDFGVTDRLLGRADDIITAALEGGRRLSRERIYQALEAKRIRTGESRGLHLLLVLALRGRLCLAGRQGKQHTFALLDEWVPLSRRLDDDEALTELAVRYFTSHGPATLKDFTWWAGITAKQALAALDGARSMLACLSVDGAQYWWREAGRGGSRAKPKSPSVQLLPAFDEYTVAYEDRSLLVDGARVAKMALLSAAVLVDGRIVGTWKRNIGTQSVTVGTTFSRKLSRAESTSLRHAVTAYGDFLGLPASLAGGKAQAGG